MSCDSEKLMLLLDGELSASEFAETEAHLAGCATCRDELGWLRTERRMVAARRQADPGVPPAMWGAIQRRIAEKRTPVEVPRRKTPLFWGIFGGFATLSAAAAAFVALLMPQLVELKPTPSSAEMGSLEPDPTPDPERPRQARRNILDGERQYVSAIRELEEDYRSRRSSLPKDTVATLDQQFADPRQTIVQARRDANGSPKARRRTLDAYAAYVHSMQRVAMDQDLQGGLL